jgi:superoxide dismutase
MPNTPLTTEERIDLRSKLLICAEKYFNDTGVNTHCGICNAISEQTNDSTYYDKMGKLLNEIFQDYNEFLAEYTNTYEEWEGRAYMCLFLAEYLQDTIENPPSVKEETKKPWYKFWK